MHQRNEWVNNIRSRVRVCDRLVKCIQNRFENTLSSSYEIAEGILYDVSSADKSFLIYSITIDVECSVIFVAWILNVVALTFLRPPAVETIFFIIQAPKTVWHSINLFNTQSKTNWEEMLFIPHKKLKTMIR